MIDEGLELPKKKVAPGLIDKKGFMILLFGSSLQYRSALVAARMRNIIFILLLRGLPLERCPSGLWQKFYDRHWRLMNDHNDRGCHL